MSTEVRAWPVTHKGGQALKSAWWMPRRAEAMKDVGGCDMPRGAANQALIRGFLNGATRPNGASRFGHSGLNV